MKALDYHTSNYGNLTAKELKTIMTESSRITNYCWWKSPKFEKLGDKFYAARHELRYVRGLI